MPLITIVSSSSTTTRKKSPGPVEAILCFLLVAILPSISNAAEVTQVTLAWDPSNDPGVAGYKVYLRRGGKPYGKPVDIVGNVSNPQCFLTVSYGGKYYFAVTACDTNGHESSYSNEVSWPIQLFSPNGVRL